MKRLQTRDSLKVYILFIPCQFIWQEKEIASYCLPCLTAFASGGATAGCEGECIVLLFSLDNLLLMPDKPAEGQLNNYKYSFFQRELDR